ncbi:MAG: hypothetical protein ACI90A_001770 [Shewanella sp.]|jgi:hypothetical protein
MKKWLVIPLVCLQLTGCAFNSIFINYPSQIAPVKALLNTNDPIKGADEVADNIPGADGLLYAQEAGRVAQIAGDFESSKLYYQDAASAYLAFDDKAIVSASELGATASSLFINDNVIPYRGPGYERVMLHQYQALNYLFSGDQEGALVEVRRSNDLQSSEQAKYQKSNESVQAMANGTINAEMNKLGEAAGSVTSSFLNAYSYYVTGVLHEVLGQPDDAFIDYRKAAQISPNNPYIQQDLVRLAKQLSMPQADEFEKRWGKATFAKKGQGEVIMLIERGFVDEKQSFTVPFRVHGSWQTASLATYPLHSRPVPKGSISGLDKTLIAAPIANIDALAITALKEELPAALVRQAARAYTKAEMAKRVRSDSKSRNNDTDFGSIAMQLFNVITEQADRRSWLTLPKQAQIARAYVDQGQYSIKLDNSPPSTIEVESGRTTLVWVIDTGNYTRFYSIII